MERGSLSFPGRRVSLAYLVDRRYLFCRLIWFTELLVFKGVIWLTELLVLHSLTSGRDSKLGLSG